MPRKSHKRDLDRFLHHLAATGNFALAAERAGKAKSGLYKRRARDPDFAARCEIALATFRTEEPALPERSRGTQLLTTPGTLTLSPPGGRRPVQLRRSPAGRLTEAGLAAFLRVLAATANVRFAAASVGVAHSSIYRRRRMDGTFAEEMRLALLTGYDRVEAALLETALRSFDYLDPPRACLGEGDHPQDGGGVGGENVGGPEPIVTGPITADQAIMLLWHHRRTCRMGWQHRNHQVRPRTKEENDRLLAGIERKIRAMFPKK